MAYKALYRTYRPNSFEEVAGQEHVVKTLQHAVEQNKIAHAYLFCGPRGTGKTSIAKIFAKMVNCESKDHRPCGECENCKAVVNGTHPDIIEIDAASNNGVEEVIKELDSQENDNSDVTFLTENDGHGNVGYKTTWIQMMDEFGCGVYEDKMEPERDAKGDIVYEDPQKTKPKMVPVPERNEKGEIVTDDDGNIVYEKDPEKPHMIEVYETEEITDEDTINKYLQTFAESKAAYIIQENINMLTDPRKLYSSKEEYKQSKASAKRLLQDYKIGNKFTRFFAPKLLLKKHKENIVNKIFDMQETEICHNPYDHEQRKLFSIESGDLRQLRRCQKEKYEGRLGRVADEDLRNDKNIAIIVITLGRVLFLIRCAIFAYFPLSCQTTDAVFSGCFKALGTFITHQSRFLRSGSATPCMPTSSSDVKNASWAPR